MQHLCGSHFTKVQNNMIYRFKQPNFLRDFLMSFALRKRLFDV